MFKRYLLSFIGLLICIMGSQNVYSQQQIALDTYAILEQSCFNCHGPTGSFKDALLIEHNALIENGTVVPGNPDTSELYDRLITTDAAKRMPLGQPQLSPQFIDTIRNWIVAGAPDWEAPPITDGRFISPGEVLNTIETHLMSLPSFDRAFARYFTLTHLYNAGEPAQILQEYRKGLSKLVNSLSWGSTVINPQPIDSQETIFYIDLRNYEWDRNDGWTKIETEYPYHIGFDAPTQTALKAQLGRLQEEMKCDIPSVHVDWFLATASLPPLYHDLLDLPLTDRELETRLEVDVVHNLLNAPGVRVWRAGTNNSGVSNNNRVVERHKSRYGAYWKSYDFAGSVGTQNIFNHPLTFTPDGGEVIFNLPNGLQGYYVTNTSGFRLDEAPIDIVSNPAASDPTVRNGLSCFGCHIEGMNTFEDEVRTVIESNTTPAYDKAQALRLYVEQSAMDALVGEDIDRYRGALETTGGEFDDIEPISRFHEAFQGTVDVGYAAAAVGLETEVFLGKIRENLGLQNIGLLVLEGENGSMKRDAWTSSFKDILFALDFPELVDKPPVVPDPDRLPGAVVHIPDPNLRAAIAESLGKSPNAPITVQEMGGLERFRATNRDVQDLTGLQFLTNVNHLDIRDNQISDLSPVAGLINLRELKLSRNSISDLSPVARLTNLKHLDFNANNISDLSPVAELINLEYLNFSENSISDLSPVAGLINLKSIHSWTNPLSDLSPLAGLTKLEVIDICGGDISDLTPLARLPDLKELYLAGNGISNVSFLTGLTGVIRLGLHHNDISDISPLVSLTQLEWLHIENNDISDISPLANLTQLNWLNIRDNEISDISPLANFTKLKWLDVSRNQISNFSPLDGLRENIKLFWYDNPAFPKGGPKIEGPWLWVVLLDTELSSSMDLLSEASGDTVTEVAVATHGATEGKPVGDDVWTSHRLPPAGHKNIEDMLQRSIGGAVLYGSVSLHSPQQQDTIMYVGGEDGVKVWLNGTLIYERLGRWNGFDYQDFFPVTLNQGRNVLLVAVPTQGTGFFGFEPGTEYTVLNPGVGYAFSKTPIYLNDTFTLDILAETVFDMAGWQFDIAFDPAILEAINVNEGNFLKKGGTTLFQDGSIDNAAGKITGLSAIRLSTQGVSGTGPLLQVKFKAKSGGETELALQNFQFGAISGESIPAGPHQIRLTVEGGLATGDVNRDGQVSILDLILIAQQLGKRVPANSPVDVNGDGIVSILDLIRVSQEIGNTTGPSAPPLIPPQAGRKPSTPPLVLASRPVGAGVKSVDAATIAAWIAQARLEDDGSLAFKQGIENLQKLLASLIPEETALLANYPNPFNPETWMPYQLAIPAEVTLTIYDINGQLIRRLAVGYQAAGMYRSRNRAAYWDGRNQLGESVASGLYFYTLTADEFTATRRMLILK